MESQWEHSYFGLDLLWNTFEVVSCMGMEMIIAFVRYLIVWYFLS